jgi:hypothetical protein
MNCKDMDAYLYFENLSEIPVAINSTIPLLISLVFPVKKKNTL